jgi:hypothetical protein
VIDQNNMPIVSLIDTPNELEANNRVMKYGKKIGMTVTKGGYVGSFHNLANPQVINNLFTRLLNLDKNFSKLNVDFFQAVKKVDWYNQYKFFKESRPLSINWKCLYYRNHRSLPYLDI